MASESAIPDAIASPISSLKYGKCHVSGASMTPSRDTNSDATTFLIESSFVRPCMTTAFDGITGWVARHRPKGGAVVEILQVMATTVKLSATDGPRAAGRRIRGQGRPETRTSRA